MLVITGLYLFYVVCLKSSKESFMINCLNISNQKNLIYDLQSGFRPGFSNDATLTYLTDYIRKQMDSLLGIIG